MSIKLSKSELWKAIQGLGKVVSSKVTLPSLSCVRMHAIRDTVTLTGTSLEETISYTFKDSITADEINFIISFDELKKFVKDGSDGSIHFQPVKDSQLEAVMESHGKKDFYLFKMEDPKDWPEVPTSTDKMDPVPNSVFEWIRAVLPSAADPKEVRRLLESVYLEKKGITATNGRELAHVECKLPVGGLIVPVTKILSSRLFSKAGFLGTASSKTSQYLCVNCDWFTYFVKCRPGTYPNYRQVIPKEDNSGEVFEFTEFTARDIVNRLGTLPVKGEHESIILYAGKHGIHIFSDEENPSVLNTDGKAGSDTDNFVKVDRRNLSRALSLFHTKFRLGDNSPVMATGIFPGYFLFMPLKGTDINKEKLLSLIKDRINPAKEENQMKTRTEVTAPQTATATTQAPRPVEQKPPFQVVGGTQENGEVFEEATTAIDTLKSSIKTIYDGVADLQRKLKEAQKAIKNKEREYQSTKQLITKLRTASGF
ncbi:MAG: DNA polymerase III subunit beta [Victivallales bacterium]